MTHTQLDAKNKICPIAMASSAPVGSRCMGADCMAWQWAPVTLVSNGQRKFVEGDSTADLPVNWHYISADEDDDGKAGWIEPEAEANKRRRGFCGMVQREEMIQISGEPYAG